MMSRQFRSPMTMEEAKLLNTMGTATGGCWRCIADAQTEPIGLLSPRTQWKMVELSFIGHRALCPKHYREELKGSRDF